jgi:ATP-dependent RNA helicase RhlE
VAAASAERHPLTTFDQFGLSQPILKAVKAKGYEIPTPIQAQAIPPLLQGRDLLGVAQTGTGKTAAFALPILNALAANKKPAGSKRCRVLVLAPTRELASQIAESFRTYGAAQGVSVLTVFGGVKYGAQIKGLLGGVDVLVATPGRLIDHMQERHVDLSAVEHFVLDEADQMLDLGFFQPIRKIVARLPAKRQNLFFSATMPKEIKALASDLLTDPVEVSVTPQATTVDRVDQQVMFVETVRKRVLLAELYADRAFSRTIVFTRTKRGADRVAKHLEICGIECASIHGDKSQAQREKALAAFKTGKLRALVATDIAARGIDVSDVTHVINFELPNVPESYVHRIGRTARAGAGGQAISLVGEDERGLLRDIQKVTRQTIPAFDRRNDSYLAQAQAAQAHLNIPTPGDDHGAGGGRNARGEKPSGRGGRNGGGANAGANTGHGHGRGQPHRDANGSRPAPVKPGGFNPLHADGAANAAPKPNRNRYRNRRPGGGGQSQGGQGGQRSGAAR